MEPFAFYSSSTTSPRKSYFYESRFLASYISRTVQPSKFKFSVVSYIIQFCALKKFQFYRAISWYSMDFTKPGQINFFNKFNGYYLRTENRYESEIFIIHTSRLDLSTGKMSASLRESFGQGTLDKIGFFIKDPIFDLVFLDSSYLEFYRSS